MKRGQVTEFIIAGLIILIAGIFIVIAKFGYVQDVLEQQKDKFVGVPSDIKPVRTYIGGCLAEVSKTAKEIVLLQGGYYDPKKYIAIDISNVALWYEEGKDISPTLKTIENEIANTTDKLLPLCIEEYGIEDYKISINGIDSLVRINKDNILAQSNVRINVNYKEINFTINEKFSTKYDSDLYSIYNVAIAIVDMEVKDPRNIELTTLSDFGYDINFFRYNENEMVYIITTEYTNLFWGNKF